jgi:two-component system, chemotaxis family, response regulator Rcp1
MTNTLEVLLVDDNPGDTDLVSDILASNGRHVRVSVARDGAEAIAFLRRSNDSQASPPDLIVLDLNLPRKDGQEVLSELKADPALARIPVVVFTTSQASADINRCYELGANCYLSKPGSLADFRAAVESMAEFWLGFASLPHKEKR